MVAKKVIFYLVLILLVVVVVVTSIVAYRKIVDSKNSQAVDKCFVTRIGDGNDLECRVKPEDYSSSTYRLAANICDQEYVKCRYDYLSETCKLIQIDQNKLNKCLECATNDCSYRDLIRRMDEFTAMYYVDECIKGCAKEFKGYISPYVESLPVRR